VRAHRAMLLFFTQIRTAEKPFPPNLQGK